MKLYRVLELLRAIAPEKLAESWDHVGLQVGDPGRAIRKAFICIDLNECVLREAITAKTSLIVAYHPPIFAPLAEVTTLDPKQRIIFNAIRRKIAIYSPHTALDAAPGGVNDWLCDGLGLGKRKPIRPSCDEIQYKLVVFVPNDHADKLRLALSHHGAGVIGDYTQCSFASQGTGTFRGGRRTNPTIGKRGRLETVPEQRMEMVCPADQLAAVIAALCRAHPYEEPAYDVYRLEPPPSLPSDPEGAKTSSMGQGRTLTLDQPVSPNVLIRRIKKHLGVKHLEVARPDPPRSIQRIGVCAGAGGALLKDAGEIDAFFTGEMRHHDVLAALARGVTVILAGHTQTERGYLPVYLDKILAAGGDTIDWIVSQADQPPSRIV